MTTSTLFVLGCVLATLGLGCGPARVEGVGLEPPALHAATQPTARASAAWRARHAMLREQVMQHPEARVVLLGDSITQAWSEAHGRPAFETQLAPLGALALGISGDRTEHLLWRLRDGLLNGARPQALVLLIGTNNVAAQTPEQIADGVVAVVRELLLRLPETELIVLDPLPRGATADAADRQALRKTAEQLAVLDEVPRVRRRSLAPLLLQPDGTLQRALYNPDSLHLSSEGYVAFAAALVTLLGELDPPIRAE